MRGAALSSYPVRVEGGGVSGEVEFERVSPVIPVRDLDAAVDRYRRLGFTTEVEDGPRYGFVERGAVSLHLIEWGDHDPARTGAHIYLYVSDAGGVYDEWSGAGVEGELGDLFDAPYGLREFAFRDPEGTLIRVGSPLP
jgi:catechol 2,3-dioxygenase-like lactoylglutathione lyase family enzyme